MKKGVFLLIIIFFSFSAFSQKLKPVISFETTVYDFGSINEEDGSVSYTFHFSNTGNQPLVIHNVRTSCRCTAPNWSRAPIQPGGKGQIEVVYDPTNRPGNFNQSITIYSNSKQGTSLLRLVGNVIKESESIKELYPRDMGSIRLKSSYFSFGRINKGEQKEENLEIINVSNEPVSVSFTNIPSHINVVMIPEVLSPGESGLFRCSFDASKINEWGFVSHNIPVSVNDTPARLNRISINATIEEDFSLWSDEELANAPGINFNENVYNFDEVKQGVLVRHNFTINNTGKSDLIIRRVRTSCGCTASSPERDVIPPGESTLLEVSFNTRGRNGRQNQAISIYSNDPNKSLSVLRLSGSVIQ